MEGITPVDVLLSRLVNEWVDEEYSQRLHAVAEERRQSGATTFLPGSVIARQSLAEAEARKSAGGGLLQRQHAGAQGRVVLVAPPTRRAPERPPSDKQQREEDGEGGEGSGTHREGERCTRRVQNSSCVPHVSGLSDTKAGAVLGTTQAEPSVTAHGEVQISGERFGEAGVGASGVGFGVAERLTDDCMEERVPIILVVNKADGCFLGDYLADCFELHMGSPVILSAKNNEVRRLVDLLIHGP